MRIHNFVEYYARNYPDSPAITRGTRTLNYSQLDAMANRLANGLLEKGVEKGDRVAVVGENGEQHLAMILACAKIGAITVELNYRLATPEIAYIIKDSAPRILLFIGGDMSQLCQELQDLLPADIVQLFSEVPNRDDWLDWLNALPSTSPGIEVDACDGVLQMYTSGTTGNPKGVVMSHGNMVAGGLQNLVAKAVKAGPGSADLICAPFFHIGGAGAALVALYTGAHVILHKTFDPEAVVNDIESYPISSIFLVPAMIMAILSLPDIESRDFSKLNHIFYGASPITEQVLRRAIEVFQTDFTQMYGMTESSGAGLNLGPSDHLRALKGNPGLLGSCGRPNVGVEVMIADSDGNEVPTGEIGEVYLKSDTIMIGYHNLPEETKATLVNGWLKTGDSGCMDAQGYVYLKDRIKDMVVSGAENIYPIEVENVLSLHPAVKDVAVIGVPDDKFGEALLACIVTQQQCDLDVEAMIGHCRGKIAGYKIPRQLKLYSELPRSPTGKVLKKELRAPFWNSMDRSIG
ncbi:long-chain-fatty-acid--CoA ligase [Parahaliea mediterranea]|uniref:Long-chain-fatty-acid--CoA ligase n=1 Tax=Parahaliea mediterranea TaxID=651086 RepID=A0A939DFU4_9GAMM|nr:long-chain-fatty-acid--CoA ligase [Parahaliea mediterranea]MBN7797510.1 long-chain-fatty-acid--CoA ligase [Parahaliea mediterranea]